VMDNVGGQVPVGQAPSGQGIGCTVEVVTIPAGSQGRAVAVDPSGRTIVGTVYDAQGRGNAVRFEDGRAVAYPGASGNAVAVNAGGLLVGYDDVDEASHTLGWTYRDGKKSMLPKLAGFPYTVPIGVNARGDVVGAAMGDGLDDTVPVLWPADKPGTVNQLAVPNGFGERGTSDARAVAIGEDGTVVGSVHAAAIRWAPDGTASALPVPDGFRFGRPVSLQGRYVYGSGSFFAERRNVAVRWDLADGTMKVLEGVPDDIADGTAQGWSVTNGGDSREPVRVTPEGNAEKLPVPRTGALANAISDDGATIAGVVWDDPRPLIWHC
jgi:hypothetical protein